jgi:hypothetical protein
MWWRWSVCIRQNTSAYVSIRIRQHTSAYVSMRQHASAYAGVLPAPPLQTVRARCARGGGVPPLTVSAVSARFTAISFRTCKDLPSWSCESALHASLPPAAAVTCVTGTNVLALLVQKKSAAALATSASLPPAVLF